MCLINEFNNCAALSAVVQGFVLLLLPSLCLTAYTDSRVVWV